MKKNLVQLVFVFTVSIQLFAQNEVTITIDSNCFRQNDTTALNGTFDLYGKIQPSKYPFEVKDTLIKTLDFKEKQTLILNPMQYALRFTPNDSTQKSHTYYFNPHVRNVHLNCFFFNKSYPLSINTMKNNDFISFSSHYYGPTNIGTIVTIYSLSIVKKRGGFYALYSESKTNEQGFLFLESITEMPYNKQRIKLTKAYRKLTDKDIKLIQDFEKEITNLTLDYYTGNELPTSRSSILSKNGYTSFLMKGFISTMLWDKLSISNNNKK